MDVSVVVNLVPPEQFGMTAEEAARAVLQTLGGDETAGDTCAVSLQMQSAGSVGGGSTPKEA